MTANQPIMARFIGGPWNGKLEHLAEKLEEIKVPEPRPKTIYAVRSYNPPALWRCDTLTEAQTASERFPGLQIREIYRREGEGNWELISPETEERETHNG